MLRLVLREQLPLFCLVLALAGMMIVAAAPPPPPGARQALLHPLRSPRLSPLHAARLGAQISPRVVPGAQSARRQLSDEPLRHGPWPRSSTSSAAATESLGRHDGKTVKRPLASAESRALGAVLSRVARARLRESRGKSPLREEGGGAGGAGGAGGSLSPSYRARSAQRRFTPTESRADTTEPDSSSGGCLDAGRWWAPRARWERVFQGKRLECTCLGGRRVHCRALRSEEPQAGKGGHGGGAGSSEGDACRDTALSRWFSVGQAWERPHRGWMLLDCRCISKGNIHCSSRNRCNDAATRRSYRAGERWQKRDAAGVPLLCTCGGNEQGQWTCVRKGPGADPDQTRTTLGNPKGRKQQGGGVTSDEVEEGVGTESPAASPLASSGSEAVPEAAAESGSEGSDPGRVRKVVTRDQAGGGADRRTRCRLGRGVEFVSGQRWTRAQGQHREICSCSAGGEAKCVPLGMARTRGGNADGDPCVFPFVFEGMALWGCTARGRTDGRQWCGTTSNFDRDSRYTYCVDEMEMLVPSQGGNSHGALCALPFSFGGRVYSECTAVGRDDGELWCSTTADFDGDGKYGFCPMNGQCSVDGVLHESGKSFFKRHEEGHLMNCTCHGRERGMWTCDGLDQCQDSDSRDYHQVGDTWAKVVDGLEFRCHCYGNGIGEWNCKRTTPPEASVQPVQVMISESPTNRHSHPVRWINPSSSAASGYNLKWRAKDSEARWREVDLGVKEDGYVVTGLDPGITYEGQLFTLRPDGHRDVTRFQFSTSATPPPEPPEGLKVVDMTESSITIGWDRTNEQLTAYRVVLLPDTGRAPKEMMLHPGATSVMLLELVSAEAYTVRLYAVSGDAQSRPSSLQASTHGRLTAPRELRVTDVEETALRAEWLPPPGGPISGYRVRCLPAAGGEEDEGAAAGHREEEELPAGTSSHRVEGLQPGQRYVITVTAVRGEEHGPPASLSVDTLAATNFLPEFRIEVNETTINISWDWWPGLEIKVLLVPSEEDGDPRELSSVSGELLLPDLTPDTEYTLTIIILLHGAQRGPPVVKHIATLPLSEREPESLAFPTVPSLYRHITADFIQQVNAQFVISTKKPPTADATSLNVTFDIEATLSSIVFRWRTVPGLSIKVRLLDKEFTSDSGELLLSDLSPGVEYTLTIVVLLHGVQRGPPAETRVKTHSIHQAALGEDFAKWFNSVPPTFTASMPEVQLKHDPDFKVDTTETSITISWNSFPGLVIKVLLVPSEGSADPLELSSDSGELLLPELSPGVEYTLTIIILLHGVQRGTPIVKRVTTLSPLSLEVAGESPSSLTLTWYQPSAPVDHYTVTCTPLSGREEVRELLVPGSSSRATLQGLATAQEYNVSIRATYGQQQQGGPMLSSQPVYIVHYLGVDQPSDMQILDLTESSIRVRWNPCRAPILGYLLTCTPMTHPAGNDGAVSSIEQQHGVGEPISMDLSRGETDVTITKLVPTVEYVISVCARRHNQDSEPTTLTFTTKVDSPRGLEFLQVAETWVLVQWEPPEGRVSSYRITYESSNEGTREFPHAPRVRVGPSSTLPPDVDRAWPPGSRGPSDEMGVLAALGEHSVVPVSSLKQGEMELGSEVVAAPEGVALILFGGDVEEANITGLTPGLEYTVRVYATYGQDESVPLTGCQVTAIPAPTDLQFHFVTASGLTVSWAAPVGVELTGFRVVLMPRDRKGPTLERSQSPKVTTTTINGLLAQTEYEVSVYALKNYLASKSLQAFQKTQASLYAPGRLRALSVTGSTVLVAWRSRAVRLSAFLLIATPLSNEGLSAERLLSPLLRACTITGLSPGVTYSISIYAMREGSRSQPTSITVTTKFLGAASPTFLRDGRSDHVGAAPGQLHTTVTWRPSGGSTEHHVTCLPIGDSSPVVKLTLPGGAEAATLRGLRPGAVYRVLVEAMGLDGRNTLLDETLSLNNTGTTEGAGEARILDGCLEGTTGTAYAPGEHWEQRAQNGLLLTCTCLGEGRGHVRCDSSKWCYDSRQSYRIGEQWSKRSHAGQKLQCTCLGNLRGEILCEPDESVCYEGGKEFSVGQQWEKVHESSACSCACLGGKEGWQCDCERLRAGQQPWQGPSSARTAQLARQ